MKKTNDIANELQQENKAIGGEWYFYDSIKDRWGGYSVGQWINLELATKLSDKKLDTRSIGKISFTGLGGRDELDYKIATDTAQLICGAVNNYQSLKESLHDLEIEHRRMKAAFEEQIKAREALKESNAALIEALELAERSMSDMVNYSPFYNDDYAAIKAALNKAKNI